MTIRHLDKMFKPDSVALIGSTPTPKTVGSVLSSNLFKSCFPGGIFQVNPRYDTIDGVRCYPDVSSLPVVPDLAIIATPQHTVPGIVQELSLLGTKAAVIITAGVNGRTEHTSDTPDWKQQITDYAAKYHMRIIGPNCLGIMVPGHCLNASFGHLSPLTGNLAFVAQSGAVLTSVLDWATSRKIGFSHFVSLGDMIDVDFGDMLNYLASDPPTRAILLYVESISNTRKFMSAARAAARVKPVIVLKAGRFEESAQAAASHTGALAGIDAVYEAAFRRSGLLRVMDMEMLFNAVQTLEMTKPLSGHRLAILTNGGGVGVLATDTLMEKNGELAQLSKETLDRLDAILPKTWSRTNPVDIIGDADEVRYKESLSILLDDKGIDAILVMNSPTAITSSTACAKSVAEAVEQKSNVWYRPMVLASWVGEGSAIEARNIFREKRIPCYSTPSEAVRGFMQIVRYQQNQRMLTETVPNIPCDFETKTDTVTQLITKAQTEKREWLADDEVMEVLKAYDIPVITTYTASSPEDAAEKARSLGKPVALKILSTDIHHKSDVGGVVLHLASPERVKIEAEEMLKNVHMLQPGATIQGFLVQPMVVCAHSRELIIGMFDDKQFGPILLFGHGGTAVEVMQDKALALPPLNRPLARDVMSRTKIFRLLQGYRNTPAANLESIALTLVKVSQLVCDIGEIVELDINPLLADDNGVLALDARMRISPAQVDAESRLAIRPYPHELEEDLSLPDNQRIRLRPIRPEDETGLQELIEAMSPEDVRMRFLHPMKSLSHDLAARMTQIDYDREMALILEDDQDPDRRKFLGGVRIIADPDNEEAEFAIMLHKDMRGKGLASLLLQRIIEYSKERGIGSLYGDVLRENKPMLKLAQSFGFTIQLDPDDSAVRQIKLDLKQKHYEHPN